MISRISHRVSLTQTDNRAINNSKPKRQTAFKGLPGPEISKQNKLIGTALLFPSISQLYYGALETFSLIKGSATDDCIMGLLYVVPACILLKSFDVFKRKK